jgi:PilZ domain-containing protein
MLENRKSTREMTLQTAKILADGVTDGIDCAVLNVSETGACILVPPGVAISETFELAIDNEEAIRTCTLVWQDGARIGVTFATGEDSPSSAAR